MNKSMPPLSADQAFSAALGRITELQTKLNTRLRETAERFDRGGKSDAGLVRELEAIEAALKGALSTGGVVWPS